MEGRFKLIRETLRYKTGDFAKLLEIPQSYVSAIENGTKEVSKKIMQKLFEKCNINIHWLLTGNGEMFIKSEHSASSATTLNQSENTNQIPNPEKMNDIVNDKELIKYLLKMLAESQQENEDIKERYKELVQENTALKGLRTGLTAAVLSGEQKKIKK